MWIPFDELPASARVWIYAVERPLTSDEKAEAEDFLRAALQSWVAHGAPMRASFQVVADQLIVLAADESYTAASGCSIDASTRWFKALQEKTGLEWMDRSLFFVQPDGHLGKIPFLQIKKAVSAGVLTPVTLVYPAQVDNLADWHTWPRPAQESSICRYFEVIA